MALDTETDVPLSVIAAFLRVALPAYLGAPDMIQKIFDCQFDLKTLNRQADFPVLLIYRAHEKRNRRNSVDSVQEITVAFDYIIPPTGQQQREKRWPSLQRVWNAIVDLLVEGHHESVDSDATVLDNANTQAIENSAEVDYGFAPNGSESYPMALGRMQINYTPVIGDELSALEDFLHFHIAYDGFAPIDLEVGPDDDPDEDKPFDDVELPPASE